MTKTDDAMAHQSKKKRDDDPPPSNNGQKPIQLQRRRVWRACESCRSVPFSPPENISPPTSPRPGARRSSAMDANPPAPSAPHPAHSAPGFRQKTALHSADSRVLPTSTASANSRIHQLCTGTRSTSPSHGVSLYTDRPRPGAIEPICCWLSTGFLHHTNCDIRSWKFPAPLTSAPNPCKS